MFINSAFAANTESATTEEGHGSVVGGETHTGVVMHGDYPGKFPPFDPTTYSSSLLWLAITFGLLYFLMNRIAVPRIASILEVRHDRISQDLDEANRMKEDADAAHAAYEHELAAARQKANTIANEAMDKAKAENEAERQKVEAELAKKLGEAEAKIADIKAKAMTEVDGIAADTISDIVEAMTGTKATDAQVNKAIKAITG